MKSVCFLFYIYFFFIKNKIQSVQFVKLFFSQFLQVIRQFLRQKHLNGVTITPFLSELQTNVKNT